MDAEPDNETSTKCRRRSPTWKYFEPPNISTGTAMCKLCSENLSYKSSVSNLKKHLIRKHNMQNEEWNYTESESETKEVEDKYPRTSNVWVHFEVPDKEQCTAKCKHCDVTLSYFSGISNLKHHLMTIHDIDYKDDYDDDEGAMTETYLEDEDESENEGGFKDKRRVRRSNVWEYFDVTNEDQRMATCQLCSEEFSYRSTSTNLVKHLRRKHGVTFERTESDNEDNNENRPKPNEQTFKKRTTDNHRTSKAWEYFTIKDELRLLATCKVCDKECSYRSTSNLLKHVRRLHGIGYLTEELNEENQETTATIFEYSSRSAHPQRSSIWAYFKHTDRENGIATCLICKKKLSYLTSITNLKRHLTRKHPRLQLDGILHKKQTIIGTDGQLYEIDMDAKQETIDDSDDDDDNDNEQNAEPMEIYLDEIEGNVVEKRKSQKSPPKKVKQVVIADTSDSSDEDLSYKKRHVKTPSDTLDKFGSYLVSLLRQLPKAHSNRLQADFVRQIMNCQNNESVVEVNEAYVRTLSNNDDLVAVSSASNDDVFVQTTIAE